ncbi:MAG: hypothetical protein K1Y36_25270 [Blastocatellia bacterium]|nr:hypothetical protein [Blastocatellia bacterium]
MKFKGMVVNGLGAVLVVWVCASALSHYVLVREAAKKQKTALVTMAGPYELHPTPSPFPGDWTPYRIPQTLGEAHVEMETLFPPALLAEMKNGTEKDMLRYQPTIGTWMQNNWGGKCQGFATYGVSRSLNHELHSILHPDDVTGIVLQSFWRHLHRQPIHLKNYFDPESPGSTTRIVSFMKAEARSLPRRECPKCKDFILIQGWRAEFGANFKEFIGMCRKKRHIWLARPDGNWKEPNRDVKELIETGKMGRGLSEEEDRVYNRQP